MGATLPAEPPAPTPVAPAQAVEQHQAVPHQAVNQAATTTRSSPRPAAKPVTATLASAHPPAPAAPATEPASVKYPGLPDYPHTQYQYRTLGTPSGALYSREAFLNRISAPAGWDAATTTNPAPIVAVIDTGFSLQHDNLKDRWAINSGETAGSLTDNDSDGYVGNWRGWDFVHDTAEPAAGQDNPSAGVASHGTMTAGLAGLIDAEATLLPLQALDDNGSGYTDAVSAAIHYAADHGAKVISLSLGSSSDDPYLHAQVLYAISKGAVVVAAAGNSGCDCLLYPAAYPEVIAVGASTATDARAGFSSFGANLDVLAPGTAGDVCSSFYSPANPTTGYSCGSSGTSFAAPIVASLAALLLQRTPAASYLDITAAIVNRADKTAAMAGQDFTKTTGYGRLNVAASVAAITTNPLVPLGQILSKHWGSLTATPLESGAKMDSSCVGAPGAVCQLKFIGPQGQTLGLQQQVLDPIYGGTVFYWDAAQLGLTPGQWHVLTTITLNGVTSSASDDLVTIST